MSYILEHTIIAVDMWTILAFILLTVAIVYMVVRFRSVKKEEARLEEQL